MLYGLIQAFSRTNRILNSIKKAVSKLNTTVDVYTVDGALVKRNVKASDAKKGLKKGLYIIGKEKVLVK